jgi:multisubunit Na+/H+ antiporter MnhF subunit
VILNEQQAVIAFLSEPSSYFVAAMIIAILSFALGYLKLAAFEPTQ